MVNLIISIIIIGCLGFVSLSENEVKDKLIEDNKITNKNYKILVLVSCLLGVLATFISYKQENSILNILYGTLFTVGPIVILEDIKSYSANRQSLRIAYLTSLIVSILYFKSNEMRTFITLTVVLTLIYLLILLYGSNNMGPSDLRMLIAVTPISLLIFKENPVIGVLAPLLISALFQLIMMILTRKMKTPVPMAPPIMGYTLIAMTTYLFM